MILSHALSCPDLMMVVAGLVGREEEMTGYFYFGKLGEGTKTNKTINNCEKAGIDTLSRLIFNILLT